jgi:hypothetical protein
MRLQDVALRMLTSRCGLEFRRTGNDHRLDPTGLQCMLKKTVEVGSDEDFDKTLFSQQGELLMGWAGFPALEVLCQIVAAGGCVGRDQLQEVGVLQIASPTLRQPVHESVLVWRIRGLLLKAIQLTHRLMENLRSGRHTCVSRDARTKKKRVAPGCLGYGD